MEMNTNRLVCGQEGAIFNAIDFASVFANADPAQYRGLLLSRLRRVFEARPLGAEKSARGLGNLVLAKDFSVTFFHMIRLRKPLKVVSIVVRFGAVFVMDNLRVCWPFEPADSDKAMDKPMSADFKVSIIAQPWSMWHKFTARFSKNFPAPRNSVFFIEGSVLDSIVNICAQHGRLFSGGYGLLTSLRQNKGTSQLG